MANDSKTRLVNYLEQVAKEDNALASKLADKSVKNFDKMMIYITDEAEKLCEKGQKSVCIDDDTVFQWARHYWLDYVEKKEEPKKESKVVEPKTVKVVQEPKKEVKPKYEQMSLFDF